MEAALAMVPQERVVPIAVVGDNPDWTCIGWQRKSGPTEAHDGRERELRLKAHVTRIGEDRDGRFVDLHVGRDLGEVASQGSLTLRVSENVALRVGDAVPIHCTLPVDDDEVQS